MCPERGYTLNLFITPSAPVRQVDPEKRTGIFQKGWYDVPISRAKAEIISEYVKRHGIEKAACHFGLPSATMRRYMRMARRYSTIPEIKSAAELFDEVCEAISKNSLASSIKREQKESACMLEVNIVDHHFGQLSWGDETGQTHYDIKISRKLYSDAVDYMLDKSKAFTIDKILYVIGNDFFNVNGQQNLTVHGTPQDEDCRWQKSFVEGVAMHHEAIDKMKQVADVEAVQVPGNHDEERAFYMGEVLKAWFINDKNVTVDNAPLVRKYKKYGKNLLGFTHGYGIKRERLYGLMPIEAKDVWSDCDNFEWHIGHVHHDTQSVLNVGSEASRIRIRTLPALVATDAWHAKNGYLSIRESQAYIWDKELGNIAQINYRVI